MDFVAKHEEQNPTKMPLENLKIYFIFKDNRKGCYEIDLWITPPYLVTSFSLAQTKARMAKRSTQRSTHLSPLMQSLSQANEMPTFKLPNGWLPQQPSHIL
jgi:hypothetical protein